MWLLMCCLSFPAARIDGYRPPTSTDPPFVPGMLVRATAIKVETGDNSQQSTMRIEHVYAGNPGLKGKTFIVAAFINLGAAQDTTQSLLLPIKQGESGIWRLRKEDGKGLIGCLDHNAADVHDRSLADIGWLGAMPTPWRKAVLYQVPHRTVLKWAQTVEALYQKPDEERIPLLKAASLHENPYVSAWAIRVLGRYRPAGLRTFLQKLAANDKLSVAGQVAADEVLCQLSKKTWQSSKERAGLMDRWTGGDVTDWRDADRIIHRLVWAVNHGEMDWPTYLTVTTKWLTEQNVDFWHARSLFRFDSEDKLSPETRALIWDHGIRLVKTGKKDNWLLGARWLTSLRPSTKSERAAIETLIRDSIDPEIIHALKEVLKREH